MKLHLLIHKNDNLLQKFPKDPDHDVIITCNDLKFELQMAFLYLESKYFDEMYQKENSINLSKLNEQALQKVLSVLYGGEIFIKTFEQLAKVYSVVNFLKIDSLKEDIIEQLKEQLEEVFCIEMLEFCFQNGVLNNQVSNILFESELEILRDPKYSMDLNKISQKILNVILHQYWTKSTNPDKEQVKSHISGILSDYFHINKIRPQNYFPKYNFNELEYIWYESHPLYSSQNMYGSDNSSHSNKVQTIQKLQQKIKKLKETIKQRQQKLKALMEQNSVLKQKQKVIEKPQISPLTHNRIPHNFPYQTAKFTDGMNKPPCLPPTFPSRGQYLTNQQQDNMTNKKIYITQMKTKGSLNKIHTRNSSRSKNQ